MKDLVVVPLGDADELTVVHHCRHHALVELRLHRRLDPESLA